MRRIAEILAGQLTSGESDALVNFWRDQSGSVEMNGLEIRKLHDLRLIYRLEDEGKYLVSQLGREVVGIIIR